MSSASIGIKLN